MNLKKYKSKRNLNKFKEPAGGKSRGKSLDFVIQKHNARGNDKKPDFIKPMTAFVAKEPFDDPKWLFEIKWDGYRTLASLNKSAHLWSRNRLSFDQRFKNIKKILEISFNHEAILDGEIVYLEKNGKPNFQKLQNADPDDPNLIYIIFDLLFLDGHDLRGLKLSYRKRYLKTILPASPNIRYSDHIIGSGKEMFEQAKARGLEGLIAKEIDSKYISRRSRSWLKLKAIQKQEAVIIGFTKPKGLRQKFGALVLAVNDDSGNLIYAGNVGTGFDDGSLKNIHFLLLKIITDKKPLSQKIPLEKNISWVEPKLVCEVKFTEWTSQGQMRHPVFMGIRSDKPAKNIIREKPI